MSDVIHLFHDGVIEQSGTPVEVYTRPVTSFAASFIGNYNIFEADRDHKTHRHRMENKSSHQTGNHYDVQGAHRQ